LPLNFASQTIYQLFPTLFDWLNLQDMTERIIIILMTVVALINVITCFLILILERTQMIGILKTLGMQPFNIKLIFLSLSRRILVQALLWGNAVGLGICALQYYFKIIKLPEETYYISEVAIDFNWTIIGIINIGLIAVVLLSLWLPAFVINYIRPIKAIRFE
jgi:lipoprotein-releasing system permease protein